MLTYTVTTRLENGDTFKTEHDTIQQAEDVIDSIYKDKTGVVFSELDSVETTSVEYKSPYTNQEYKKLMGFDKEILAIRIIENAKTNIHLQQLKALCAGLEIPNVEDFVLLSPESVEKVGEEISTIMKSLIASSGFGDNSLDQYLGRLATMSDVQLKKNSE